MVTLYDGGAYLLNGTELIPTMQRLSRHWKAKQELRQQKKRRLRERWHTIFCHPITLRQYGKLENQV